ncbi:hypothetical protein V1J52_24940 [Streptomyces sp. TRM 70351]|uniref:hypothetical protein n=1 Tax=Streptomyces sp. TRM 70351 TaxID=3116552 RepID=UPI002E7B1BAC|nr:hypothetical protein [Streptomyces sp. TRM 70351]MEE1931369.1 hypothetical protein [Streptomyces sp. TRM 70351]
MDRRTTTAVALASAVLAVLSGTGCSERTVAAGEALPEGAAEAVRGAADVLARAGTSRVRTEMEVLSGGTRVTIRGVGGFDYARRTGRLEVTLPDEGRRPVTEIIAPGALYMKHRGAGVPADKWVEVDPAALTDGNLVTNGVTDPLSAAELLRGAGPVAYAGTRRLDGETVRYFRGSADVATAAAGAVTAAARAQLTAAARWLAGRPVHFDVYLDDRGRLRKVRHTFVFGDGRTGDRAGGDGRADGGRTDGGRAGGDGAGGGRDVEVVSTTALHAFGAPVTVELPRRGDVYTGEIAEPVRPGRPEGAARAGRDPA